MNKYFNTLSRTVYAKTLLNTMSRSIHTKRPPAIIGVGKNYLDHSKEMGTNDPLEHMLTFMKNPNALIGNGGTIIIPKICKLNGPQVDFEGELALIIGEDCKDVSLDEALSKLSGYAVANDVSARWW